MYLLIATFPLAVAGQNIGVVISFLALFYFFLSETDKKVQKELICDNFKDASPILKRLLIATSLFVFWMCLATHLAPHNASAGVASYFIGSIPLLIMPPLVRAVYQDFSLTTLDKLWKALTWVSVITALLSLSQYIFEWHRHTSYYNASTYRAQGLYSHPLTFAYAFLAFWPLAILQLMRKPKSRSAWIFFISIALCLWTSESRTAIVTAILFLLFNALRVMKAKYRSLVLVASVIATILVCITENPVSQSFKAKFAKEHVASETISYPVDRLAFWHAHWQLIKESPFVGQGVHIPTIVRNNAFAEIGLADFEKKYPAHNMFIQVTAEGGFIGLILFCIWYFGYIYYSARNKSSSNLAGKAVSQGLLAIAIAGITQNAFQDSEVRHIIMLLLIIFWCTLNSKKTSSQKQS